MRKIIVEDLWVKVTYEVKLGNLEIPEGVYDEIQEALDKGDDIKMNIGKYPDAEDWLSTKINESDCMEWKCEIVDLVLEENNDVDL